MRLHDIFEELEEPFHDFSGLFNENTQKNIVTDFILHNK